MNRYAYFAIGTIVSAVAFLSVAHGQIAEPLRFQAPMAFQIGQTRMEAGAYTVRPLSPGQDVSILLIESEAGRACAAMVVKVDTPDHSPAATTMVKFQREGNLMRLTRIYAGGANYGFQILEGKGGESGSPTLSSSGS